MASNFYFVSASDSPLPIGYFLLGEQYATTIPPRGTLTVRADVLDHSTNNLIAQKKLRLNPAEYTPAAAPVVSSAYSMLFASDWVEDVQYLRGSVARYNGFSWVAKNTHTAVTPPSSMNADWAVLSVLDSNTLYGVDLSTMADGALIFKTGGVFGAGLLGDANVDTLSISKITGLTSALAAKLPLAGGTMTGALTLAGAPTSGLHAATKTYVDSFLPKAGGTLTGFLTLHAAPTSANHAATKAYVDGVLGPGFLPLTGGTMTGPITLSGAPTSSLHPATKAYVDNFLLRAGGVMTGALTLSGVPTASNHAANKAYVDQFLLKSGGTLTGFLTLHAAPTSANHAATKAYVDTAAAASRTFVGKVSVPTGTSISAPGDLVTLEYLTANALAALPLAGGTMSGFITLHANPSSANHAANKAYVDAGDALNLAKSGGAMTGPITGSHGLLPLSAGTGAALTGELSLLSVSNLAASVKSGLVYSVEKQTPAWQGKGLGIIGREVNTNTDYTVVGFDGVINADSSSVAVVITFGDPSDFPIAPVTVRKVGASWNAPVYIRVPEGDGRNSLMVMSVPGESITLLPSATAWLVVGRSRPSVDTFTVTHTSTIDDAGVKDVLFGVRGYEVITAPFSAVGDEGGGIVSFTVGEVVASTFQVGDVFTVTNSADYDDDYVVASVSGGKVLADGVFTSTGTGQINAVVRPLLDNQTTKIMHFRCTDSITDPWTLAADIELVVSLGDEVHPGVDAAKVARSSVTGSIQVDITNTGSPRTVYLHALSAGDLHGHINGGFDSVVNDTIRYAANITAASDSSGNAQLSVPHTHGFNTGDDVTVTGTGGIYDGVHTVLSKTSNTVVLDVAYASSVATGTVTSADAISLVVDDPSGFSAGKYVYVDGVTALGATRTALLLAGVVSASGLLVARHATYDSGLTRSGMTGILPVVAVTFS